MLSFTPPFRFSATLEARLLPRRLAQPGHESDVKAVAAPYADLILTASRDETVCSWSRAAPGEREFRMSSVGLGHASYVNSVAFAYPHGDHPTGLIASGSLSGLILIHDAPTRGSWASSVDGEAGATPGREDAMRPSEQPIQTLIGHSHNVCSLSTSTPSWVVTPLSLASSPSASAAAHAASSYSVPSSGTSSPVSRRDSRPLSLSIPALPTFGHAEAAAAPISPHLPPASTSSARAFGTPKFGTPTGGSSSRRSSLRPSSSGSPILAPASHPRFPPPGAATTERPPVLISTSWDCTARVWSLETFECLLVLEGHKEAVWCGLVVEGGQCGRKEGERSYLTASADRTIIHWDDQGRAIRNFKGSTDVVRSLALLPNNEFAACSNDGSIRIFSFDGECRAVLLGHKSFVYSVCVLPNGDIASAGEDHCVRIWSNGKQIQMILHPAISVWSVAALPNGDLVTGASDYTARIFTRDSSRVADFDVITAYEEAVTENIKSPPLTEGADAGPSYFKLSVDVADDRPPLELNFDTKEAPKDAAERFVGEHELPEVYVDQITTFIRSHLPVQTPQPTPAIELSGFHGITAPLTPTPVGAAMLPSLEAKLAEQIARDQAEAEAQSSDDDWSGAFRSESERTLEGAAELIRRGSAKKIVILSGAGISTSAGIPDFRSPETGLYANLERFDLPYPEAVFDLDYFKENPKPFYELAKELYPGKFLPTYTHYLFYLLQQHGLLQRVFTQNIDTLERVAGVRDALIVEAHGSFASARCTTCSEPVDNEWMKAQVESGTIPRCPRKGCGGTAKPDIIFFGESLPDKFFAHLGDLASCDLLLVFGTSLKVHPFASLIDRVPADVPRVLINQEVVGEAAYDGARKGFHFGLAAEDGGRDVMYKGDSDSASRILARGLRLEAELDAIVAEKQAALRELWNLAPPIDGSPHRTPPVDGSAQPTPVASATPTQAGQTKAKASKTVDLLAEKIAKQL